MANEYDNTLIKWVCSECGSNNMSHKALVYQCSICNKIRSTEPLMTVNGDNILEPPVTEVKIRLNKSNWYKYLDPLSEQGMCVIARILRIALRIMLALVILLFFIHYDSWNEVLYNLNSNWQSMKMRININGIEQMLQQCQNCYLSILSSVSSNIIWLKNKNLLIQTDTTSIILDNIQNKYSIILQNKQLLENEFLKRIVNTTNMFPVLLLHMKELSVTLIDNANIYYHNLIQKLIDTKVLVERKFSK